MKKWINKVLTIVLIIIISVTVCCFLLLLAIIYPFYYLATISQRKRFKELHEAYQSYLQEIDGTEFFCYTNRKTSQSFVEEYILPKLDKNINMLFLEGWRVHSNFNEKFLLYALYNLKPKTVPCFMKVKEGNIISLSLHDELYAAVSGRVKLEDFLSTVDSKILELRETKKRI